MFGIFGNGENTTSSSSPLIIRSDSSDNKTRDNLSFANSLAVFLLILGLLLVIFLLFGQNNRFLASLNPFAKKGKDKDDEKEGNGKSNATTNSNSNPPVITTSESNNVGFPIYFGTGIRPDPKSADVEDLQRWLRNQGYAVGVIDGRWGNLTEAARKAAGLPGRFASREELERVIGRGGTFTGSGGNSGDESEVVVFK